jgi:hypothetical protein
MARNVSTVAFASRLGGGVLSHFQYTPCIVISSSGQPVMVQIDCLQAAEGALDPGEALIGADHLPAARALFSTLGDSTSGAAGLSLDLISLDELWLRSAADGVPP